MVSGSRGGSARPVHKGVTGGRRRRWHTCCGCMCSAPHCCRVGWFLCCSQQPPTSKKTKADKKVARKFGEFRPAIFQCLQGVRAPHTHKHPHTFSRPSPIPCATFWFPLSFSGSSTCRKGAKRNKKRVVLEQTPGCGRPPLVQSSNASWTTVKT